MKNTLSHRNKRNTKARSSKPINRIRGSVVWKLIGLLWLSVATLTTLTVLKDHNWLVEWKNHGKVLDDTGVTNFHQFTEVLQAEHKDTSKWSNHAKLIESAQDVTSNWFQKFWGLQWETVFMNDSGERLTVQTEIDANIKIIKIIQQNGEAISIYTRDDGITWFHRENNGRPTINPQIDLLKLLQKMANTFE